MIMVEILWDTTFQETSHRSKNGKKCLQMTSHQSQQSFAHCYSIACLLKRVVTCRSNYTGIYRWSSNYSRVDVKMNDFDSIRISSFLRNTKSFIFVIILFIFFFLTHIQSGGGKLKVRKWIAPELISFTWR